MLYGEERREKRMVEAIEEGKIVRVPEEYAKREELPVLRKIDIDLTGAFGKGEKAKKEEAERDRYGIDEFRKPLRWKENDVRSDLVHNFHWEVSKARRKRNLTRKQFAELINESENTIKMVENGILPANDFILVNKIQSTLGINLRKDGFDAGKSARAAVDENVKEEEKFEEELFSDGIEIVDEE